MAGREGSDRWSLWLLAGREGGDQALRERLLAELAPVRGQILERGRVGPGDVVLDVGAGDGLIAFAAPDRVGPEGRVIFADVSGPSWTTPARLPRRRATHPGARFCSAPPRTSPQSAGGPSTWSPRGRF